MEATDTVIRWLNAAPNLTFELPDGQQMVMENGVTLSL